MKVNVVAIVSVFELVSHHSESHDLLADEGVGPGDVHSHLRVVDLVSQTVLQHLREIPTVRHFAFRKHISTQQR